MTHYYTNKLDAALLDWCLAQADSYAVHVPDGDGPLSEGRLEFAALPDSSTAPWDGMRDSLEITGPLTPQAEALFRGEHRLWDYRLLVDGVVLLQIGDFTDTQVTAGDADLAAAGISTAGWDRVGA